MDDPCIPASPGCRSIAAHPPSTPTRIRSAPTRWSSASNGTNRGTYLIGGDPDEEGVLVSMICVVLLDLHLNRPAGLVGGAGRDHKIAALGLRIALHDLPDRTDRVDDSRSRRIGHECGQRLERSAAVRPSGKREHVGLLRRETG